MEWSNVYETIEKQVVKIETSTAVGTGFLFGYHETRDIAQIATACHVVKDAHTWQAPIRIVNGRGRKFLTEAERLIRYDDFKDSAVLHIWRHPQLQLPRKPIRLIPANLRLKVGEEVGWIGYPAMAENQCCFFSGKISSFLADEGRYLIDGVAINGVSGGPVIYRTGDGMWIVGSITAYFPNRATGETLPGLSVANDVSHLHVEINAVKHLDAERRAGQK